MPPPHLAAEEQHALRNDPAYHEGIDLFNHGHFWHAHEAWEMLWLRSTGTPRQFIQGLIQVAAALVHWKRANRRGLLLNWNKAHRNLSLVDSIYAGLDVAALIDWMDGMAADAIPSAPLLTLMADALDNKPPYPDAKIP